MESQQTANHRLIKILFLFTMFLMGCQGFESTISLSEEAGKAEAFLECITKQEYETADSFFAEQVQDETGIYALIQQLSGKNTEKDAIMQQMDSILLEYCLQSYDYISQTDNTISFHVNGILPSLLLDEGFQDLLKNQIQGYYEQNERSLYLLWQVYGQQDYEEKVSKDLGNLCSSLIQAKMQSMDPSSYVLNIQWNDQQQIVQISSAQEAD